MVNPSMDHPALRNQPKNLFDLKAKIEEKVPSIDNQMSKSLPKYDTANRRSCVHGGTSNSSYKLKIFKMNGWFLNFIPRGFGPLCII